MKATECRRIATAWRIAKLRARRGRHASGHDAGRAHAEQQHVLLHELRGENAPRGRGYWPRSRYTVAGALLSWTGPGLMLPPMFLSREVLVGIYHFVRLFGGSVSELRVF